MRLVDLPDLCLDGPDWLQRTLDALSVLPAIAELPCSLRVTALERAGRCVELELTPLARRRS
jgi:hypothetical protein